MPKPYSSAPMSLKSYLTLIQLIGITLAAIVPAYAANERQLSWLEDNGSSARMGTTFGVPWAEGKLQPETPLSLLAEDGRSIPVQTWPLAYWPDGSLKWTGVAAGPIADPSNQFTLAPEQEPAARSDNGLQVGEDDDHIRIDTGRIQASIAKSGQALIPSIIRENRVQFENGRLVALNQNQPGEPSEQPTVVDSFESQIDEVVLEQSGPVRAVVRIEGKHHGASNRELLPFIVRLYFYADSPNVRMVHTFIYDVDDHEDFIRGVGIRFDVPLTDPTYDRHVRFSSAEGGLWNEAVQGITGLRRDPGEEVRQAQAEGRALPSTDTWDQRVTTRLQYIPLWNDYTLNQLSADGFEIAKRTAPGHAWIRSAGGTRASGMGYLGGPSGGVAFGLRDFWQSHPSQINIRNAAQDTAEVTLWLWAPAAKPMDMRFYHDGLDMVTMEEQRSGGMAITYEDYADELGTPYGIARTSELNFWITDATPSGADLLAFAEDAMNPPLLVTDPAQILETQVFGGIWTLPNRSTPTLARIEDMLDHGFENYVEQREAHRWYGFWDYGDVIHSFDGDRNMWRYDVGGYGWANSELSPDIWLWTKFLRSGRADVFRFAEAMTRHTGEVDVYHIGPIANLGTRHHVQHWGDGMKQLRISTPIYRRYFYYLTADERTGVLMRNQVDAYETYRTFDPWSKEVREEEADHDPRDFPVGLGTDYSAVVAGWFIEWERTLDPDLRDRLVNMMTSIGEMPYGFYSVDARLNTETGEYTTHSPDVHRNSLSHLFAVFGLPEINAELIQLFDVPSYKQAWIEYSKHFNSEPAERLEDIGVDINRRPNLRTYHSRLTGYAAYLLEDEALAHRAWQEILGTSEQPIGPFRGHPRKVEGADSLNPFEIGRFMSTNWVSEWNNAMMQNLYFIGDYLEEDDPRTQPQARSTD